MSESVTDFNRSPNAYASSRGLRTGLRRRARPGVRLSIGTASTGPFPRLERLGPRESRRTYGSSTTKRNLPNQRLVLPAPIPIRKHFWSSTHSPLPWNAIAMRPTKKNLKRHAAKPLTRWLIRAANDRSFVTYGQAKRRLETEAGFTTIFSAHMGVPAGELMYRIQDIMPDCPLLNVLLVQQGDKMPSEGVGPFMADYLADPRLADPEFRSQDPQTWRTACDRIARDVYAFHDWDGVYEDTFGEPLPLPSLPQAGWMSRLSEPCTGVSGRYTSYRSSPETSDGPDGIPVHSRFAHPSTKSGRCTSRVSDPSATCISRWWSFCASEAIFTRTSGTMLKATWPQTRRSASCSNSGTGMDSPNCCLPGCFANTLYPPRGGPTFESP